MAYTTINKSSLHYNGKLYTGNGSTQSITGVGFQPDWVWIKNRTSSYSHTTFDAQRGTTKRIMTNESVGEETDAQTLTAFGADGFSLGTNVAVNQNSTGHIAYNWKAGGSTSSNSNGTITSTVSVNSTAGFSIVKWTGNGTNDATIGHGLGAAPKLIIVKNTADDVNWRVYHESMSANHVQFINTNQAEMDPSQQGNGYIKTVGTSTFSTYAGGTDDNGVNGNGDTMIAYCFLEKTGFSKMGTYTANNSSDGPFIYTGFRPTFFVAKTLDIDGNWHLYDDKRLGYNDANRKLTVDTNDAEETYAIDIVSNGIKIRSNGNSLNNHTGTMIYWAFGQSLVGTNNVVANAR